MFLSLHAVADSVGSATEQSLTSYVVADAVQQCNPSFYYILYMHIYICNHQQGYNLASCHIQETVISWIVVKKNLGMHNTYSLSH